MQQSDQATSSGGGGGHASPPGDAASSSSNGPGAIGSLGPSLALWDGGLSHSRTSGVGALKEPSAPSRGIWDAPMHSSSRSGAGLDLAPSPPFHPWDAPILSPLNSSSLHTTAPALPPITLSPPSPTPSLGGGTRPPDDELVSDEEEAEEDEESKQQPAPTRTGKRRRSSPPSTRRRGNSGGPVVSPTPKPARKTSGPALQSHHSDDSAAGTDDEAPAADDASTPGTGGSCESPMECGTIKRGVRVLSEYMEFFGKEVELYTASRDPKKRVLVRASQLADMFKCATNKVGMYLARRRHVSDGLFQATSFKYKPSGRTGLKSGGYFLGIEVCQQFQEHYAKNNSSRSSSARGERTPRAQARRRVSAAVAPEASPSPTTPAAGVNTESDEEEEEDGGMASNNSVVSSVATSSPTPAATPAAVASIVSPTPKLSALAKQLRKDAAATTTTTASVASTKTTKVSPVPVEPKRIPIASVKGRTRSISGESTPRGGASEEEDDDEDDEAPIERVAKRAKTDESPTAAAERKAEARREKGRRYRARAKAKRLDDAQNESAALQSINNANAAISGVNVKLEPSPISPTKAAPLATTTPMPLLDAPMIPRYSSLTSLPDDRPTVYDAASHSLLTTTSLSNVTTSSFYSEFTSNGFDSQQQLQPSPVSTYDGSARDEFSKGLIKLEDSGQPFTGYIGPTDNSFPPPPGNINIGDNEDPLASLNQTREVIASLQQKVQRALHSLQQQQQSSTMSLQPADSNQYYQQQQQHQQQQLLQQQQMQHSLQQQQQQQLHQQQQPSSQLQPQHQHQQQQQLQQLQQRQQQFQQNLQGQQQQHQQPQQQQPQQQPSLARTSPIDSFLLPSFKSSTPFVQPSAFNVNLDLEMNPTASTFHFSGVQLAAQSNIGAYMNPNATHHSSDWAQHTTLAPDVRALFAAAAGNASPSSLLNHSLLNTYMGAGNNPSEYVRARIRDTLAALQQRQQQQQPLPQPPPSHSYPRQQTRQLPRHREPQQSGQQVSPPQQPQSTPALGRLLPLPLLAPSRHASPVPPSKQAQVYPAQIVAGSSTEPSSFLFPPPPSSSSSSSPSSSQSPSPSQSQGTDARYCAAAATVTVDAIVVAAR